MEPLSAKELNYEVASKIFGYTLFYKKWKDGLHSGYNEAWLDRDKREMSTGPKFSESLEDAFKVVSRMTGEFESGFSLSFGLDRIWIACFKSKTAESEYLPVAICKAALLAVGDCEAK